ncbi:MAG: hypothetical protein LQ348_004831 [Seirophora lacunosa]|nr:MAG: hypothetical protein LQ348_004831 [Seirophora lacunosa]
MAGGGPTSDRSPVRPGPQRPCRVPTGPPSASRPSPASNQSTPAAPTSTPSIRPDVRAGSSSTARPPRSTAEAADAATGRTPMRLSENIQAASDRLHHLPPAAVLTIHNNARQYNNSASNANAATSAGETPRRRAIPPGRVAREESDRTGRTTAEHNGQANARRPTRPPTVAPTPAATGPNGTRTSRVWTIIAAVVAYLCLVHLAYHRGRDGGSTLPRDIKIPSVHDKFARGTALVDSIHRSLANPAIADAYKVPIRELSDQASVNQRNTALGYQDVSDSLRGVVTLGWGDDAAAPPARSGTGRAPGVPGTLLRVVWPWYPGPGRDPAGGRATARDFLRIAQQLDQHAAAYIDSLGQWNTTVTQIFDALEPERASAIHKATHGRPSKYRHLVDYIRNYNVVPPNEDVRVLNRVGVSVCRTRVMLGSLVETALRARKETADAARAVEGATTACEKRRKGCGLLKEVVGGKAGRVVSAWLMEHGRGN